MCNKLIINYIPFARSLAWKQKKKTGNKIYYEDLESAALFGLVDAAQRFIPKNGDFRNFARKRIIGAMYDYLREIGNHITLEEDIVYNNYSDVSFCIDEILWSLPSRSRKMFALKYLEGKNIKEVAECFGITNGRVSQVLNKCKKILVSQMDEMR